MLKKNIIFSLILLSTLLTTSLFGALAPATAPILSNQRDNTLNAISRPRSSLGEVTEKWSYNAPNQVYHVAISSDGKYIAAAQTTNVTLFHRDSNVPLWEFEADAIIDDIAISWNGTYVVACCTGYAYLLNSTEENQKTTMWNFTKGGGISYSVDISLDGMYISVGVATDGAGVYLLNNSYSSQNKKEVWHQVYSGPMPHPHYITISGDGNYTVAGGSGNNWVDVYNETKINPKPREWRYDTTAAIKDIEISHSGDYFIVANADNEVYLFNTTDDQHTPMWKFTETVPFAMFQGIAISEGGNYSIAVFAGRLYYFNNSYSGLTSQKEPLWDISTGGTRDLDMSEDGKYIVVGTMGGGTLYLINSSKTTPKTEWWSALDEQEVKAVSINGDGDYFVAGTNNPNRLHLYHHDISGSTTPLLPGRGDDDDDDDEEAIIPFGNYYLLFAFLAIISLIVIIKRKAIFKE